MKPIGAEILSGVFEGRTLGTPISIMVRNEDARPEAYAEMAQTFRPSHADFTYEAKYGIRNWQGGGRASARETIGRVAAGAVARKVLSALHPQFEAVAYVTHVYDLGGDGRFGDGDARAGGGESGAMSRCRDGGAHDRIDRAGRARMAIR